MAWIRTIPEDEAEGPLGDSYRRLEGPGGKVDHILKIHSLNPPSLDTHYAYYRTIMFGKSGLSRARREMVAVAVSASNQCHY